MTRLTNTFNGGTDGVTISVANSGGGSGTAWGDVANDGGTTIAYDDDAPAPLVGAMSARLSAGATGTARASWTYAAETTVYTKFYLYMPASNPTNNFSIMDIMNASDTVFQLQLGSAGTLRLRDNGLTLRYTSSALTNSAWHRIETRVVHSTTVGHMQARIFSGANVHGSTPDQSLGSAVTNWDTGSQSTFMGWGIRAAAGGSGIILYFDDVEWDDTDWIGSSVAEPEPELLATPTGFTFDSVPGERTIESSWASVEGADDGYRVEVQILDLAGDPEEEGDWSAFDEFPVAGTTLTLTEADGLDWSRSYRGRCYALTTDDN